MIDTFGLAISHGLIALAVWRLMRRPDLNDDRIAPPTAGSTSRKPWKGSSDA